MARPVATYSIAACDRDAGQWGVATQSKFLSVGSVVPWAEPGVGAIATQAYANPRYGPEGLALLRDGLSAEEVVERLTSADEGRDPRPRRCGASTACTTRSSARRRSGSGSTSTTSSPRSSASAWRSSATRESSATPSSPGPAPRTWRSASTGSNG